MTLRTDTQNNTRPVRVFCTIRAFCCSLRTTTYTPLDPFSDTFFLSFSCYDRHFFGLVGRLPRQQPLGFVGSVSPSNYYLSAQKQNRDFTTHLPVVYVVVVASEKFLGVFLFYFFVLFA